MEAGVKLLTHLGRNAIDYTKIMFLSLLCGEQVTKV
jgi:hypothetical protein